MIIGLGGQIHIKLFNAAGVILFRSDTYIPILRTIIKSVRMNGSKKFKRNCIPAEWREERN